MIISVGEVVWDDFGDHRVLGGAPVNVAYHLKSLQHEVAVITRIGSDQLGENTRRRLAELGLPLTGVQVDPALPTGRVLVTMDGKGEPMFEIQEPAAWDNLDEKEATALVTGREFHLVFGTLAQRRRTSRETIRSLRRRAGLCFYDVNLRPPFTGRQTVLESLTAADLVKVNRDELRTLAGWLDINGEFTDGAAAVAAAEEIRRRRRLTAIAVTEGDKGAWLVSRDGCFNHAGNPVQVVDTVGAGDAFFAALIDGYLNRLPWEECLGRANRRGAHVASRPGATPVMPLTNR